MKDIKDYFSSPSQCESVGRKERKKRKRIEVENDLEERVKRPLLHNILNHDINLDGELMKELKCAVEAERTNGTITPLSGKRKGSGKERREEEGEEEGKEVKSKRKKKKNTKKDEGKGRQKLKREETKFKEETVESEEDNTILTKQQSMEDVEERKQFDKIDSSLESPPEKNKILNYFSKVDKREPLATAQRRSSITVKAVVHSPPSEAPKRKRKGNPVRNKSCKNLTEVIDQGITIVESVLIPCQVEQDEEMEGHCEGQPTIQQPTANKTKEIKEKRKPEELNRLNELLSIGPLIHSSTKKRKEKKKPVKREVVIAENELPAKDSCKEEALIILDTASPPPNNVQSEKVGVVAESVEKRVKLKSGTLASYFKMSNCVVKGGEVKKKELAARRQFLNSGVPDQMKKLIKTKISETVEGKEATFWSWSHIRQRESMKVVWNLKEVTINLRAGPINLVVDRERLQNSRLGLLDWPSSPLSPSSSTPFPVNIKQLQAQVPDIPVKSWYKAAKGLRKEGKEEMWSRRYSPSRLEHFFINAKPIQKLRSWLENLRVTSIKTEVDYSSGEEFERESSRDGGRKSYPNTALLVGPPGSGKTSAVYAIASSLGYQVLELNASCRRGGKRVLLEFSEATQSHQVEANSHFFTGKSKKKKKVKTETETDKRSLILIEDAELVFEEVDEGYIGGLVGLAVGSKRPLVLTVNHHDTKHLSKISPLASLTLHFNRPSTQLLGCWLKTICLVEKVGIERCFGVLERRDPRQALLQLQFNSVNSSPMSNKSVEEIEEESWERLGLSKVSPLTGKLGESLAMADLLSKQSQLGEGWSGVGRYWRCRPKESTQLKEDLSSPQDRISSEIRRDLLLASTHNLSSHTQNNYRNMRELKSELEVLNKWLEGSSVLSRTGVAVDYLPYIRRLSALETKRLQNQTKRNNRFFNYIHQLGIPPSESLTKLFASTFTS